MVVGAKRHDGVPVKGSEIFIGGLPRSVTESMILQLFSSYGEIVELRMMKDQNGVPKGFCFVRFTTKEAALAAQKDKDGYMLNGKKIGVALSSDDDTLFFGNLCKDWRFEEFDKLVRQAFKDVTSVDLAMFPNSGNSTVGKKRLNRGFAFVQFTSHAVFNSAAARAYRIGSNTDFLLGDLHPAIDWAEKEPEFDAEELAKVKVAFVGNLPQTADEDYLKELFEPFGKLDKVAISRKSQCPVGFVHFAKRSDLDDAIRIMNGKTVTGPKRGPSFQIQVSIAKPMEKDRKRSRDEEKNKPPNKSELGSHLSSKSHQDPSVNLKAKAPKLDQVSDLADPYEEAVVSLPHLIKDRLLRILRLRIATRYDIDMQCISSLKELPESSAAEVLDMFMLSAGDRPDKGAYFASLIARHLAKLGISRMPWNYPKSSIVYPPKESEAPVLTVGPFSSSRPVSSVSTRHIGYSTTSTSLPLYSSHPDDSPFPRIALRKPKEQSPVLGAPLSSSRSGLDSNLPSAADRIPDRPQVKFDPFTGEPYRFDPFTGEPIQQEPAPRRYTKYY